MRILNITFYSLTLLTQLAFITLFLVHNKPGLTNFYFIVGLGILYAIVFSLLTIEAVKNKNTKLWLPSAFAQALITVLILPLLVYIILDNLVWDYFQAITTSEPVIYTWLISWTLIVLALVIHLVFATKISKFTKQHLINLSVVALLGLPVMWAVDTITSPQLSEKVTLSSDIFVGGTDGYKVYRIPAMLVIPSGSQLNNGTKLTHDRIIVMAEARRDAALDTGVIDLVQKHSDDGGKSWSEQSVICQYKEGNMRGKCGNATPVFDSDSGKLFLAYNLSGIPENNPEGNRPHTAHIKESLDGGLTYSEDTQLSMPNSVFGPGHGIQKQFMPNKGRLIIPYNTSVGGQGSSVALYSDDNGLTWVTGQKLGTGNENEIAELSDGRLLMATRHIAPVGAPPEPNGRLFSVSENGGGSWQQPTLDQNLLTPICQASLLTLSTNKGHLFLNPANKKARVQLMLRHSANDGKVWQNELLIFPGPSGYSQLAELSDGNVLILFENGNLSYSEKITFVKLPLNSLLK